MSLSEAMDLMTQTWQGAIRLPVPVSLLAQADQVLRAALTELGRLQQIMAVAEEQRAKNEPAGEETNEAPTNVQRLRGGGKNDATG